MNPAISHSRPFLGQEEIDAVLRLFQSGWVVEGHEVEAFEKAVASHQQRQFGIAVDSGTSALHLALSALEIKEDDEILIPSYTCSALLNAVRYVRAKPVLVDSAQNGFNMDPVDARRKRTPRTRAAIVPYMFGIPSDPNLYETLEVPIIGDIAQAFGSEWKTIPLGKCHLLSICSFYVTKIFTTIKGGMVLTDDPLLAAKCENLRSYANHEDSELRYNYRLPNLHAAVGLAQMKRLNFFLDRRKRIASCYHEAFENYSELRLPFNRWGNIYYRYPVQISPQDRNSFVKAMKEEGIICGRGVQMPLHRSLNLPDTEFPMASQAHDTVVSIPLYPALTDLEVDTVIAGILKVLRNRTRATAKTSKCC